LSSGFVRGMRTLAGLAPPADAVHLRYAPEAYDDRLFAELGIAAPPSLDRAVAKRRAEFLAGRLAAREALRPLGLADRQVSPGEDRAPQWPPGIVGSISHCSGHAVALCLEAGTAAGVGIDVERIMPAADMGELPAFIAKPAEFELLNGDGARPGPAAATLMFSAKESVYKALFPQVKRILDHGALELVSHDRTAGALVLALGLDLAADLPRGFLAKVRYRRFEDLVVSACLLASPGDLQAGRG